MKKIVLLAVLVFAAWQASKHWGDLFEKRIPNQAVVENNSNRPINRLRLTVGDRTFVREHLEPKATVMFPFEVRRDGSFGLVWEWGDAVGEQHWSGGFVAPGPILQRYRIIVHEDGSVVYLAEALPTS